MDSSLSSGVFQRIRGYAISIKRTAVTFAQTIYSAVILRINNLTPVGRVRLRFLVYLSMILTLNYLSTVGMTSSPALLEVLRYNTAITKLSLSYVAGLLFVNYVSQRLNFLIQHIAMMTIPSMLMCLLEEDDIWLTHKMTFSSFLFLLYVSSIVPRKDSVTSLGPVTVIISLGSMYVSLLMYIVPELVPWQWRGSQTAWFFGLLLAATGLIVDDLQVVMGSSAFPVGLVKRRARQYAYVIFIYYLVLYYAIANLLGLQKK